MLSSENSRDDKQDSTLLYPDSTVVAPLAFAPLAAKAKSYWYEELWKNRSIRWGLTFISIFVLIALAAPLLAHRFPLLWIDSAGWSSPLLRELLAPTDSQENFLEQIFNYLLFALPVWIIVNWLARKFTRSSSAAKYIALLIALLVTIPFFLTKAKLDYTPYAQLAQQGQGWGIFPLIAMGPVEQGFGSRNPPSWWADKKTAATVATVSVSNVNADTNITDATKIPFSLKLRGYHVCGTDHIGRDVLVRMIHGARISLSVGIFAVAVQTVIGLFIGSIAGYFGGKIDFVISRIIEVVICFPTFFLILTVIALMDKRSILNIMIVIGVTGWTGVARLIRGEVLKQKSRDYVLAANALGSSSLRVIFRHILPNAISPVFVTTSFAIAGAILTETGLSFLGFGVQPPTPTWGELLRQAQETPLQTWWLALFPGLAIFFGVFAYNLTGDGLRDQLDPRMRLS